MLIHYFIYTYFYIMFSPGIKFICFDFDGTFTDCQFYVSSNGFHMKAYNGKDSYGIKMLKDRGIKTALLTAHNSECFDHILEFNHFNKLDFFNKGSQNKIEILDGWRRELGLQWSEMAYIGDDLGDLECIKKVGFGACPSDAVPEVIRASTFKSQYGGGHGAVREFVNHLISHGYLQKYSA